MPSFLAGQEWLIIAAVFFGIMGYIAFVRWRDRKWVQARFGQQKPLAMSFGVNYFGRASESGRPRRSSGFLLLMPDSLFYRSRTAKIEVDIPVHQIAKVYPGTSLKGVELHQSVMKVDFINEQNEKDVAAFRVPYPPQWIQAIQNTVDK
jgi:hypothetical protein